MKVSKVGNRWWFSGTVDGVKTRFTLGPGVTSQKAADAWLSNYKKSQNDITLFYFIRDYLHERRHQLSADTLRSYKWSLDLFVSSFGVHRKMDTITAREISSWASLMLDEGKSPQSVNLHLRNVKAAFNRALSWELISKVPKIEMVKTSKRLPRHLTEAEFQTLLDHEADPDFKRLWIFMVYTGVRRSEVLGLRWPDINLGDKPQAQVIGKGDKQRMVPLLPPAVQALGNPADGGNIFPQVNKDFLSHRFLKVARSAGLKCKLHDLRHTALTWMVGHGVPIKLVQEIAGHVDIKTTLGYAQTFTGGSYDTLFKSFGF